MSVYKAGTTVLRFPVMSAFRVQRYIMTEVVLPALIGLVILTFILLMGRLPKLVEMIINKGVPFLDMVKLFGYMLPSFFVITLPMAFLLGILLGFGRLSADSEIVALKSSGIGLYGLMKPVFLLAVVVCLISAALTLVLEPASRADFRSQLFHIATSQASVGIQPGIFNDEFDGLVMYTGAIDERSGEMTGVFISDERGKDAPSIVVARHGRIISDPKDMILTLRLQDGTIQRKPTGKKQDTYQVISFRTYDINLNIGQDLGTTERRVHKRGELSMAALRAERDHAPPGPRRNLLTVEILQRIILPFAPLLFALIGVPLGIQSNRSGRGAGFAIGLGIFLAYYVLLSLAKTIGTEGVLPPVLALWLPNLLFLAGGLYFLHQAAMEKRIFLIEWLTEGPQRLRRRLSRKEVLR